MVVNNNPSIADAARLFGQSLPPQKHLEGQEALRFARWYGEEKRAADVRPVDLEAYVETFGASAPNAPARAEALKSFLIGKLCPFPSAHFQCHCQIKQI